MLALSALTATWLGVTAYVHADLAAQYDPVRMSGTFSQGDLFRAQSVLSCLAAVLVFAATLRIVFAVPPVSRVSALRPSRRVAVACWLITAGTALGSFAAVLLYRYVNVGRIAFLPNMYEPAWFREKALSAGADLAAALLALLGAAIAARTPRSGNGVPASQG